MIKGPAAIVADGEFNIGFIKIAQLGRKRMANILVRDHNFCRNEISARGSEITAINGGDEIFGRTALRSSPERENVYANFIVFDELDDGVKLLFPFVVRGNRGVRRGPPMRYERAILGRHVEQRRWLSFHMTAIARLFIANIEGVRRLFRER